MRITTRNARFQLLTTLLTNRTKRGRAGEFLVQGVRPITLAVEHGWRVRTLLHETDRRLSSWAQEMLQSTGAETIAMSPELLAELAEKEVGATEVLAVVEMPPDDLGRIPIVPDFLGVVFDRPTQPGNIGSVVRSADAFGAHGLVVTGHAADPYDPKAVRASTGSLFALPTVRAASHHEALAWIDAHRAGGRQITVVATDEEGGAAPADVDLTGPVLLAVGNETVGLSRGWRDAADVTVAIPMAGGAASSLNAANAASIVLYEAHRQRLARG